MNDPTQPNDPTRTPQQPGAPYGSWGQGPYPPLPPRPTKKPGRALPIILGLLVVFGFGALGLLLLMASVLSGSAGPSSIGSKLKLKSSGLAMLRIEGPIMQGPSYDFWMRSLREFERDSSIRGVILRIDSPGGSVGASQELYDEVLKLRNGDDGRKGKAVYVSMGDLAASGAYYISAAADKVYANRGTLTGSIGVISTNFRIEELAEKAGVKVEVIKSGRFKDAGSMFRPMTEPEQKVFDVLINDAYVQFVDDILAEREKKIAAALEKFPEENWEKFQFTKPETPGAKEFMLQIADGRVYTGAQAIQLGLVDELGALNHVVKELAEDLGISGTPEPYEPIMRQTLMDILSSKVEDVVPKALVNPSLQYRLFSF